MLQAYPKRAERRTGPQRAPGRCQRRVNIPAARFSRAATRSSHDRLLPPPPRPLGFTLSRPRRDRRAPVEAVDGGHARPISGRRHGRALERPRVPQHRARDHGRAHRRLRGRRVEPVHVLRRHRLGRDPEDDEQRDHLRARLRRPARVLDRRPRDRALGPAGRSTWGPASPTTASRRPGATASTRRSTAARPGSTWASRRPTTSGAWWCTRRPRTSSTSPRSGASGARTRSAGSTRRRTAAAPGPTRSSWTRTPASWTWRWTRRARTRCTRPRTSAAARRSATTAAVPAARSGRRPTAGRPGRSSPRDCPEGEIGRIGDRGLPARPEHRLRARRARQGGRHLPLRGPGRELGPRCPATNPRPSYYSKVHIDPNNDQRVWVLGAPMYTSEDGGKTFKTDVVDKIHGDYHALWIDPAELRPHARGQRRRHPPELRPRPQLGLREHRSRSRSSTRWRSTTSARTTSAAGCRTTAAGRRPSRTLYRQGISNDDWMRVGGGDGFYCVLDPTDPDIVYIESQDGNVQRLHRATGQRRSHPPRAARGREVPLQLELADPGLASRPEDDLLRRQQAVRLARPRRHLDARLARPDDERRRQARRHADLRQDGQGAAVAQRRRRPLRDDHDARRVAAARGRAVGGHRRRQPAGLARRRRDLDERGRPRPRRAEGHLREPRRAEPHRRGRRLRRLRRPPRERLRRLPLLHLGLRPDLEERLRQPPRGRHPERGARAPEERRRAVRRHRARRCG